MKRLLLWSAVGVLVLVGAAYAAMRLSPWPAVWLIRRSFDAGSASSSASIAALVPAGIQAQRGLRYDPNDPDALLDAYAPANAPDPLPAVVWIHGGAFVSGSRSDLANYLQILAARGYAVIGIDYTLAPEARFPRPLQQTAAALAYVQGHAAALHVDPRRIFLAGDSAGAQLAAQMALLVADGDYARNLRIAPGMPRQSLRGMVLFCGPYDPAGMNFSGAFGGFMRTVIWAYFGTRDPHDGRVARLSVTPHVVSAMPPAFISVGNADPLAPQSLALADALRGKGVQVDTLFFPADHQPPLAHEYQMLLATQDGHLALERAVEFLNSHATLAQ